MPRSPPHIRNDDVPSMDRRTTERYICQAFLPIGQTPLLILLPTSAPPDVSLGASLSTANKSCSTSGVPSLLLHHHATLTNLGTHRNHPQTLRSHPKVLPPPMRNALGAPNDMLPSALLPYNPVEASAPTHAWGNSDSNNSRRNLFA